MADYDYPDMSAFAPASGELKGFFDMTRLEIPLLNLDAWSGYGAERQRVYDIIRQTGAQTLVLSGDSHMAFANVLHDARGQVALEVAATTITGPSLGTVLAMETAPLGERLAAHNRDIAWCDHLAIGFIAVRLTRQAVEADFIAVADPRGESTTTHTARRATARAGAAWSLTAST